MRPTCRNSTGVLLGVPLPQPFQEVPMHIETPVYSLYQIRHSGKKNNSLTKTNTQIIKKNEK